MGWSQFLFSRRLFSNGYCSILRCNITRVLGMVARFTSSLEHELNAWHLLFSFFFLSLRSYRSSRLYILVSAVGTATTLIQNPMLRLRPTPPSFLSPPSPLSILQIRVYGLSAFPGLIVLAASNLSSLIHLE